PESQRALCRASTKEARDKLRVRLGHLPTRVVYVIVGGDSGFESFRPREDFAAYAAGSLDFLLFALRNISNGGAQSIKVFAERSAIHRLKPVAGTEISLND